MAAAVLDERSLLQADTDFGELLADSSALAPSSSPCTAGFAHAVVRYVILDKPVTNAGTVCCSQTTAIDARGRVRRAALAGLQALVVVFHHYSPRVYAANRPILG